MEAENEKIKVEYSLLTSIYFIVYCILRSVIAYKYYSYTRIKIVACITI